jgi:hypothetical protein
MALSEFTVFYAGDYPYKKREYFPNKFKTRQKARNFCRNRRGLYRALYIRHPDGSIEEYPYPNANVCKKEDRT